MNNQFFGDVRDFYKYALLRILSNSGKCSIAVCWLLTTDSKKGGNELAYLHNDNYRQKDEKLFDFLHECVYKKNRNVKVMNNKIICGAEFFADDFPLSGYKRNEYWEKFIKEHGTNDLLFFDVDTGIMPKGGASKNNEENEYIRECEIKYLWTKCDKSSLMIFQFFYLSFNSTQTQDRHKKLMLKLRKVDEQAKIFCLYKSPVAYYFMIRKGHNEICDRINSANIDNLGFEKHG